MLQQAQFPHWLDSLAAISLAIGIACALIIAIDLTRRPQEMWIMNLVWPLTALFGGLIWLTAYLLWGRRQPLHQAAGKPPFPVAVFKGASHCGAGCTLGDVVVEWTAFAVPGIAVWFGWHTIFDEKIFAVWILDFLVAFLFGIIFQYFTIAPMRHLSPPAGIVAAIKADIFSITAWQIGMYGVMGQFQFGWFRPSFGGVAKVASFEFWFAMQGAMLGGFLTAYPVNWWLIKSGLKERM